MNAVMLDSAVIAAPFSAPWGTAAPTVQALRRGCAIAPATPCIHRREVTSLSPRCTLTHDVHPASVTGSALFAHIRNVVAPTAGRGLAQPAV